MTWLKFKHETPKKQVNMTTILGPFECAFTLHLVITNVIAKNMDT